MTVAETRRVGILLAIMLLVHLWLGGRLGLAEDEAYYWVFSRHLAAGYLDHPPAIAWLIKASTLVLGDTQLGVRAGTALLGAVGLIPAILLARNRGLAAFALVSTPLLFFGGVLATPDVPLLAAWSLALWAAARRHFVLLGVAVGLAMLSKYTGVLLLPLIVLSNPRLLRQRGLWLAAGIAFVLYLPNAIWNVQHDLLSWRFQLQHAAGQGAAAGAGAVSFVGAQLGLVGPVIFLAAVAWWAQGLRGAFRHHPANPANPANPVDTQALVDAAIDRLCWWTSFPLLLLATATGGEANWAAPAWIGAVVGLSRMGGRWPRVVGFGAGLSAVMSLGLTVQAVHPLVTLPADPLDRLEGGKVLADSVAAWDLQPVWTRRYQEAALIHFYSGIPAHALPDQGRPTQYDLWPLPKITVGSDGSDGADGHALFVRPWRGGSSTPIDDQGWRRGGPNTVTAYAATADPTVSRAVMRWQVYEVWGQPSSSTATSTATSARLPDSIP